MFCAMDDGFDFESFILGPKRPPRRKKKWKIFQSGDLKFVILRLISQRPMHGYEVMKALEEESKGYYRPSPGSVYPTLQMLDDEGYVTVEEQDGKKIYTITDEGLIYLGENEDIVPVRGAPQATMGTVVQDPRGIGQVQAARLVGADTDGNDRSRALG